jgi:hypothetical protein
MWENILGCKIDGAGGGEGEEGGRKGVERGKNGAVRLWGIIKNKNINNTYTSSGDQS